MYPTYTKLTGFTETRLSNKYALYLYRDDYYQREDMNTFAFTGIPVIFIPGNAGSYKQARSIGSLAAQVVKEKGLDDKKLDLFTADFQEDFTAFHGRTLLDQAEYINDAIRYILKLYDLKDSPHPESVIVIGHSMGGFIARALVALDNYKKESINTIITLASPHAVPPLTFDSELTKVYKFVNKYWADAYSEEMVGRSPLRSVALVSITGGKPDNMVPADYAAVSGFTRPSNAFATFSFSMPGVWTGIDHQAIVWCHQCRAALVNALLEIVDPLSSSKTKSLEGRMQVFAKYFLSGFEPYQYNRQFEISKASDLSDYYTKSYKINISDDANILDDDLVTVQNDQVSVIRLNHRGKSVQVVSSSEVEVLLCSNKKSQTVLECHNSIDDAIPIPHSSAEYTEPFMSGYKMNEPSTFSTFREFETSVIQNEFTHLVVRDVPTPNNPKGFTVVNQATKPKTVDVNASILKLLFGTVSIQIPSGQTTDISLKGASSSLLSYIVQIKPQQNTIFTPLVRQYVLDPFESKFHTNIQGNKKAYVFFHGLESPFIDTKPGQNLHIQIFTPPAESAYLVRIRMDWWGILGNIVPRYRTILIPFSVSVVLTVILIQLHFYTKRNIILSFSEAMNKLIKDYLLLTTQILVLLQFALSFVPVRKIVNIILHIPFLFRDMDTPASSVLPEFVVSGNQFLVGLSQINLLLLISPLLFLVSIGMTVLTEILVTGLIDFVLRYLPKPTKKLPVQLSKVPSTFFLIGAILGCLVTHFYVPYPLVYTAAVVYYIYLFGRSKYYGSSLLAVNFGESLLILLLWMVPLGIPVVISWIHTLIEYSFWQPCSSHRSIISVIPILAVLHFYKWVSSVSSRDTSFNTAKYGYYVAALKWLIVYIIAYSLLSGFNNTYMLFYLVNIGLVFLCFTIL